MTEPCPFCGWPPRTKELRPRNGGQVKCVNPECFADVSVGAPTLPEAVERWNQRVSK